MRSSRTARSGDVLRGFQDPLHALRFPVLGVEPNGRAHAPRASPMIALLLAVAAVCSVARTDAGKIARSRETIRQFMREVPCPGGVDKGSRKRCRGFVVDHSVPLCAGG